MNHPRAVLIAVVFCGIVFAFSSAQDAKPVAPKTQDTPAAQQASNGHEYSGMYSFLKDGEFVQITVEDAGRVTGFVSRYGEGDSDNGAFLDHYFRSANLDGSDQQVLANRQKPFPQLTACSPSGRFAVLEDPLGKQL